MNTSHGCTCNNACNDYACDYTKLWCGAFPLALPLGQHPLGYCPTGDPHHAKNKYINKGVSGRLRHPLFGRGLRRWCCERRLAGDPQKSIKYEWRVRGWMAEASPMRPCTSRRAPSAGSPRRRVHEGGSSEEWRSYTALGPDACVQAGKSGKLPRCSTPYSPSASVRARDTNRKAV